MGGRGGAVGLAEGVTAGNERDGLFVVHRHSGECLADVLRGGERVRVAVRALRIHVDQAHLYRAERIGEVALPAVARVGREPRLLGAPRDIEIGFPDVLASAAESDGLESHRLERDVADEDHQVGPRDLAAVLLLDRPEQAARLVEADVVGPAVERREALLPASAAAAAVADTVRAGAVPGEADEQAAVVAEVRGPPVLRVGHQRGEVRLHGREVEACELLRVVEVLAHRIGPRGMLVQEVEPQAVRPPILVRRAAACGVWERALVRFGHWSLLSGRFGSPRRCRDSFPVRVPPSSLCVLC